MFVTDLVNTRLVNLTFVYIKKAVSSELRGEKGPGLLIDSMLKKIQTELKIFPPTEVHERVWAFSRVLPLER